MTWWMVLLLIFGILFLIGCIPVGVDAAYLGGGFTLKIKIWLLRLQLLPAKPKTPKKEKASAAKDGKKHAGGKAKAHGHCASRQSDNRIVAKGNAQQQEDGNKRTDLLIRECACATPKSHEVHDNNDHHRGHLRAALRHANAGGDHRIKRAGFFNQSNRGECAKDQENNAFTGQESIDDLLDRSPDT